MNCSLEQYFYSQALQYHFTWAETAETFEIVWTVHASNLNQKGFILHSCRFGFFVLLCFVFSSPGAIITNVVNPAQTVLGDN